MTGSVEATPEGRAARRGGVLAVTLMPLLGIVGVVLLALAGTTAVLAAAGATLLVLSGIGVTLGVVAIRGSGPVAGLRNVAAIVAVAGIGATLIIGLIGSADDGGTGMASAIGLMVLIAAAWAIAHVIAVAVLKARRAGE